MRNSVHATIQNNYKYTTTTTKMTTDMQTKQHSRTNMTTTGLLLALILFSASCVHQSEATLFFVGGACRVGLGTARLLVGNLIAERGLETPVQKVDNLCRFMQRYSIEGVFLGEILPRIFRLVSITARGSSKFNLQFDEFQEIVLALSDISEQVVN